MTEEERIKDIIKFTMYCLTHEPNPRCQMIREFTNLDTTQKFEYKGKIEREKKR